MIRKIIIFLVRTKLGLKKYEHFRFSNQESGAIYYFTKKYLYKVENGHKDFSGVSLNWLLNKRCKVIRIKNPLRRNLDPHIKMMLDNAANMQSATANESETSEEQAEQETEQEKVK